MKLVIPRSRNGKDAHLTLQEATLAVALGGALVVIAAVFGALLQRYLITSNASSHGFGDLIKMQSGRDADFFRENVSLLARKVGTLQAKPMSIDSLWQRVAREAGVAYTDPELVKQLSQTHEGTEVMDDVFTERQPPTVESAQELARKLDEIQLRLSRQADDLKLLYVALTRRSAAQVRLLTAMPITDYPYLSSSYGWRLNPVTGRSSMRRPGFLRACGYAYFGGGRRRGVGIQVS